MSEADKADKTSNLDALDPRRIKANMPDEQEAAKEAEELNDMCDDTKRRGAGIIRAGLFGIRPQGMDKFNKFHEKFTDRGKAKKKERKLIDPRQQIADKAYQGPRFKVVAFPETFCVHCARKDCQPGKGMLNIQPVIPGWQPRGLLVGDVIRCIICDRCTKQIKEEERSSIQVFHMGQMVPSKVLKQIERAKKIQDNIMQILNQSSMEEVGPYGDANVLGLR